MRPISRVILVAGVLLIGSFSGFGQNLVSGDFQGSSFDQIVQSIESQTKVKFYYLDAWVDSLTVTATFSSTPLNEALKTIFEGSEISFLIYGDRIILSKNQSIIEKPAILSAYSERVKTESIEKGLVFSREYLEAQENSDIEKQVIEIGSRSLMKPGTRSTIAGYVRDAETSEAVAGALVYQENPMIATTTDESGFYTISLTNGRHELVVQFTGMKTTRRNLVIFSDGKLNIEMKPDVIALDEVTVESDRDRNVIAAQMGVSKISVEEVKTVPIVLGENDIMKVATAKPGVQTVGEGATGFNVRGGKADQNLILFNGAPVYNPNHFFGFFSSFNSDAIQSMDVYTSGMPASFGGRLSSVFDIHGKEANQNQFSGEGGISPITSRMTFEVPIINGKAGVLFGGRTTYSNWVLKQSKNANFSENKVNFYDIITQVDYKLDKDNDLQVSGYMSSDKFRLSSDTLFSFSNFAYQNKVGSVFWTHRYTMNFESKAFFILSDYQYELFYDESLPNAFTQDFGINEASVGIDYSYFRTEKENIQFGISAKRYGVNPGGKKPYGNESLVSRLTIQDQRGLESAIYGSYKRDISKQLSFTAGLRYVMFNQLGPVTLDRYAAGGPKNSDTRTDSVSYGDGEIVKTYHAPEWRFTSRYSIDMKSSVKLSVSRNRQYVHALSNSASLSPTDTWIVSGTYLKPQSADQFSVGYYRNMFTSQLEVSVETYYKRLENLVDFKTGAEFLLNQHIEREVLQGDGKSYGVELSLTKSGRLNGWFNYTYARTFIRLNGTSPEERVNSGKFFPTSYDKPHTVNLVANYKLTRRLSFSLNSQYKTGRPITIPVAAYDYKGGQSMFFSDRNAYRIPDYFRVDLGVNLEGNHKISKLAHSFWSLSIYNLTGRDNPYSVFFDVKDGQITGSQLVVFGSPIPTLTYNFKF